MEGETDIGRSTKRRRVSKGEAAKRRRENRELRSGREGEEERGSERETVGKWKRRRGVWLGVVIAGGGVAVNGAARKERRG